jgi:hypothetical protein
VIPGRHHTDKVFGTHRFQNITIAGNQIAICTTGIVVNSSLIHTVAISGNVIGVSTTASGGIVLIGITRFAVTGNVLNGGGGTSVGVYHSGCTNGIISSNMPVGFGGTVTPASGSVVVVNNPT